MDFPFEITYDRTKGRHIATAIKDIKKDELVEDCPVILTPNNELADMKDLKLDLCHFSWDKDNRSFPLGFPCIYASSQNPNPNLTFKHDYTKQAIQVYALRHIGKGEELAVDPKTYN